MSKEVNGNSRKPLTFNYLSQINELRCIDAFKQQIDEWSPAEWAMACTGELGELCNLLKKKLRGEDIPTKAIADEFADVMIYLDLWANRCGIDLGRAVVSKFNETSDKRGSKIKL